MAESDRPSKRQRPEPGDGSGPVAVSGAGGASVGDSSSSSYTAAGRLAMQTQYRRWWKGAWDETRCLRTLRGHSYQVRVVAVLEGDRIVSASVDHTLKVWSLTSGECLQTLRGHTGVARRRRPVERRVDRSSTPRRAQVLCVAVLPNGRVVSGSRDNTLKVWDASSGECLRTLGNNIHVLDGHAWLARCRRPSWHADLRLRH